VGGANPIFISRQKGFTNAKRLFTIYAKWIDGADRGRGSPKPESARRGTPGTAEAVNQAANDAPKSRHG
jgi:integrase